MPVVRVVQSGGNSGGGGGLMRNNLNNNNSGINICCCRICTCINLNFLTTKNGVLKLCEMVLGSFCQTLLIRYGLPAASDMGEAFHTFLTTVSSCLMTTTLLLFCYIISSNTFHLIRQSLFEIVFNAAACFFYLSASSYMAFAVTVWLHPRFIIQPAYMAYPAMMAVYYIGIVLGLIHGVDGYMAYKYLKGYR